MYSQLEGEGTRKMHFVKGIAIGFGAGLLLATVVTMAVLPNTNMAESSDLMAVPFSTAARNSLRNGNPIVARGWRTTHDGRGHPQIGMSTAVKDTPSYSQAYQPPASAPVAPGQYSPEQLEFMRRAGKMPSMEQPVQQAASVSEGQYSPEQLEFLRRAGKMPQQSASAQGQYSASQLEFMRRKMDDQYSRPSTSWDSPSSGFDAAQGRRDGYAPYHNQRFN